MLKLVKKTYANCSSMKPRGETFAGNNALLTSLDGITTGGDNHKITEMQRTKTQDTNRAARCGSVEGGSKRYG